jgi:hypothetical protein
MHGTIMLYGVNFTMMYLVDYKQNKLVYTYNKDGFQIHYQFSYFFLGDLGLRVCSYDSNTSTKVTCAPNSLQSLNVVESSEYCPDAEMLHRPISKNSNITCIEGIPMHVEELNDIRYIFRTTIAGYLYVTVPKEYKEKFDLQNTRYLAGQPIRVYGEFDAASYIMSSKNEVNMIITSPDEIKILN